MNLVYTLVFVEFGLTLLFDFLVVMVRNQKSRIGEDHVAKKFHPQVKG